MTNEAPLSVSDDVLSCTHGDVTYLLSLRLGAYTSLNGIAKRLWNLVEKGHTRRDCAELLMLEFQVPAVRAHRDVDAFLRELSRRALLKREDEGQSRVTLSAVQDLQQPAGFSLCCQIVKLLGVSSVFGCLIVLAWSHWSLKVSRFHQVLRAAMSTAMPKSGIAEDEARKVVLGNMVTRRVRAAAAIYPWRTACLEQSLTGIVILRLLGVDAGLRLGIHPYPFSAHAWVESDGTPLNELPDQILRYRSFPILKSAIDSLT
jgi:hypothetical protein